MAFEREHKKNIMYYEGIVIITTCLQFYNIPIDSTINIIIITLLLTFIGKCNKCFSPSRIII